MLQLLTRSEASCCSHIQLPLLLLLLLLQLLLLLLQLLLLLCRDASLKI
jgi:hypothetical protein